MKHMKSLGIFGVLITVVFVIGTFSIAEAHPHATIDLMESHSHEPNDDNFQEEFILHDFEHVILSMFNFIKNFLFG